MTGLLHPAPGRLRAQAPLLGVILSALAGCNLLHGPPRAGECQSNLRTILSGEENLYAEHQRYSEHPAEVGFAPVPGNRYLYLFAPDGGVTRRDGKASVPLQESVGIGPDTRARGVTAEWLLGRFPPELRAQLGLHGRCPACTITVGCLGNLDDDDAVDAWTIASEDRTLAGSLVHRGTPFHHLDDTPP